MARRPSTIDRLPDDVREKLHELLRDPRVTQLEATRQINEILEREGHEERLSKSSLNRYAVRMEAVGQKMREAREVADMWIGKLGARPEGEMGNLINQLVRSLTFDVSLKLQEGELDAETLPGTIDMLKDLALTAARLEKASSENVKREAEIRRQAREEAAEQAAEAAEQAGRRAGLSDEGVAAMRDAILKGL
ncbi:DUF3486 family protein [Sediminicurvatus halobius]|uniref:DUF3486 domain-containing protein n=1 Tax=Sediminicurvatus halobius TaxID=2182432 RepID=A0A2U2N0Y1_9GAMM|nr:DUF3486 family protein [Spiribacter halobius]PWG62846.1 hypothetical protein DEM34_10795 [Spiribacter halobius]UEX77003.1 DUF3486 family protein [Spiribacter halobius]